MMIQFGTSIIVTRQTSFKNNYLTSMERDDDEEEGTNGQMM
jgi:hypothetical protein